MSTDSLPNSIVEKLLSVFSTEQLEILADSFVGAQRESKEKRCTKYVEVAFNEKGFPRYLNHRDSVALPAPVKSGYSPE